MNKLEMNFFNNVCSTLKPYIRHYFKTSVSMMPLSKSRILPMDHVDILIPVKGELRYSTKKDEMKFDEIIFHGLRTCSVEVYQDKYIETYGISFTSSGFYAFIGQSLKQYIDAIVPLNKVNTSLSQALSAIPYETMNDDDNIEMIEQALLSHLINDTHYLESKKIVDKFIVYDLGTVAEFCEMEFLQRKTFERMFNNYVGMSPHEFKNLQQFERASRKVLFDKRQRLTDIAYDEFYTDQAYFSNQFKRFTSYSPNQFRKFEIALKSKMNYKK